MQWPDSLLFWMNLEVVVIVVVEGHPVDLGPEKLVNVTVRVG